MLKRLLTKDISGISGIKDIKEGGRILLDDGIVEIYSVEPINIVSYDEATKRKIYDSYVSVIRGMPNTFQILISKRKDSLKSEIEIYKKRLLEVENYGLKIAIKKYVDYLEELEASSEIFSSNHYLVLKVDNEGEEISGLFSNLREFGLSIAKITSKKQIEDVFRRLAR